MANMTDAEEVLADFERSPMQIDGIVRDVYRLQPDDGPGPAVIVISEIPGITPLVAEFARRLAQRGMTAVLPDLFGVPGRTPSPGYLANSLVRTCIRREFHVLAMNKTSPVVGWLRGLARVEHQLWGGPGVGVVGMCFTGGFALAMTVDPVVVAPVMSQPSLPVGITSSARRALGLDAADLEAIKARTDDGLCVLGLRFTGDRASPPERFDRLRDELGDAFIAVEIDSSPGNSWGYRKAAHSVLTEDYNDAPGSPTQRAMSDVLDFCATRLNVE